MLRLTGGVFRGRQILTPQNQKTRPTQSKTRQALFNSLQTAIPDARVVDLFAGSGALGFEALSRGAEHVVFIEESRSVASLIARNAQTLGVEDRMTLIGDSVDRALSRLLQAVPYDVIMADPPYGKGWELTLLQDWPWDRLLTLGGYFCIEWGIQKTDENGLPNQIQCLEKVREKNYGDSMLTTYRRNE